MKRITEDVERKARTIRARVTLGQKATPVTPLEYEIAFWSEQLDLMCGQHEEGLRQLLCLECALDTDLMALGGYSLVPGHPAREHVKDHLRRLDGERRLLIASHQREIMQVQQRLVHLLSEFYRLHSGQGTNNGAG